MMPGQEYCPECGEWHQKTTAGCNYTPTDQPKCIDTRCLSTKVSDIEKHTQVLAKQIGELREMILNLDNYVRGESREAR